MSLKDYYSILELQHPATETDIKKAYRKLALKYHPDKNHNDPYAGTQFAEIKEAYEVLTNPSKKAHYLQQRWYNQSTGRQKMQQLITPVSILKQVLELEKYVSRLDQFRMDKEGLHDYISTILSDATIEKLNASNDPSTNEEIIKVLLKSLRPLPIGHIIPLHKQISKIHLDPAKKEWVEKFLVARERSHQREKYRIWLILLVVIILCLLIFFLAGNGNTL